MEAPGESSFRYLRSQFLSDGQPKSGDVSLFALQISRGAGANG